MSNRKFILVWLLFASALVVGWTELVDNFYGKNLDKTTFQAPATNAVPKYDGTKWIATTSGAGSTITVETGGVSQGSADTLDFTNGIVSSSTATAGTFNVSPTYGAGANTITQGNDTRHNPAPSGAGKVVFDNGSAYVAAAAGASTTVLHGGTAPSFSEVVSADITDGTIAMADLANLAGLSIIGRSASASGVPAALTGTANQIPIVNSAGTTLAFVTVSGDLTNSTGVFTIANQAVSPAKMADLAGVSLLGRSASTSGVMAAITGTANQIPIINSTTTALTFVTVSGDITNNTGSFTISNNVVSNAKLRDSTALSLIGRSANSTGDPADIAGTANQIPIVNSGGTALAFTTLSGDVTNSGGAMTIAAQAVGVAKMTASATDVVFGRSSAGAGAGQEITFTSTARSIADDTSVGAVRTTLSAYGTVTKQVFSTPGTSTYTPTSGALHVVIECWGGGGAGGSVDGIATNNVSSAGGGAGGYSRLYTTAAAASGLTVTVGAAGTAAAAGNNNGGNGGDSSVGTICVAKGGTGGGACNGTTPPVGGAGGVAGTGDVTGTGPRGNSGFVNSGTTVLFPGGNGASSAVGTGGAGGTATSGVAAGSAGSGFASGGGGGIALNTATDTTGGNGAGGLVVITEFTP